MADTVGSALLRRHIGRRFAVLRTAAGLTQEQAARAVDRGRITIARIEDGNEAVRFREIDVKAMLDAYGATKEEAQLLLAMTAETRNGRRKSWWHDYTQTTLPEYFQLYVTLEDSAETIRQYEPELIPGLLQTPAYQAELNRVADDSGADEEEIERRVRVRMERQALLTRPRAPRLDVILNEAVLHRPVGGAEVMAEQLQRLLDTSRQPNVSVRILPFAVGVHGGMTTSGAFSLLEFPTDSYTNEPLEPPLVYVETLTGALYLQKPDELSTYRLVWKDLELRALDEHASESMITTALEGLTRA